MFKKLFLLVNLFILSSNVSEAYRDESLIKSYGPHAPTITAVDSKQHHRTRFDHETFPVCESMLGGTITNWRESGMEFHVDDFIDYETNLETFWSINTLNPGRGWFYGANEMTKVAMVSGVTEVSELINAASYSYVDWSIGPVEVGDAVVLWNSQTGFYAAMLVDAIDGESALDAKATVRWYLLVNGGDDFSVCNATNNISGCINFFGEPAQGRVTVTQYHRGQQQDLDSDGCFDVINIERDAITGLSIKFK